MSEIIDKIIDELQTRLQHQKLKIILTEKAKQYILENAFDERYGARPIKRFISKNIETLLAEGIIKDEIKYDSEVTIDVTGDKFIIK